MKVGTEFHECLQLSARHVSCDNVFPGAQNLLPRQHQLRQRCSELFLWCRFRSIFMSLDSRLVSIGSYYGLFLLRCSALSSGATEETTG